jgi:hypothetical protein
VETLRVLAQRGRGQRAGPVCGSGLGEPDAEIERRELSTLKVASLIEVSLDGGAIDGGEG